MSSVPQQIGPYLVEAEIGRGGMGVVYRARDPKLNRAVAIKVLPEEFARDAGRVDRFRQEAMTLAGMNHPNILTVHDVDTTGEAVYVVTELLDGLTSGNRHLAIEIANMPEHVRGFGMVKESQPETALEKQAEQLAAVRRLAAR